MMRIRAIGLLMAVGLLAVLLNGACSDDFETVAAAGGGPGAGGGTGASGCDAAEDCAACKTCARESACAALLATCVANPACVAVDECVVECGDAPSCLASCTSANPTGTDDFLALSSCLSCDSCPTACTGCGVLHCVNGVLDGDESAIDCGGASCAPCETGETCSGSTDCESGYCAGGVCCADACGDICFSCSIDHTGQPNGECHAVTADTDPGDQCPGTDTCNGGGACRCGDGQIDGSESDIDCGGPDCAACANGKICTGTADCASGNCVDGVCCDDACTGECQACVAVKTGGADGACAVVPSGSDPDNECNDQGAGSCGNNGVCDGGGSCALYSSGTACGSPQSCSGGIETKQDTCNGVGACIDQGTVPCAPYSCGPFACAMACINDAQCSGGYYCNTSLSICEALKANGQSCSGSGQCQSNSCVDGYCCNGTCGGTCQACSAAKTGQTNGICAAVLLNTDPDNECQTNPVSTCDQTGQCNGLSACQIYPSGTVCGAAPNCAGGVYDPGDTCNGSGTCTMPPNVNCSPYVCNGTTSCHTSCTSNAQCISSHYCEPTTNTCNPFKANGATCGGGYQCTSLNCVDGVCCNTACTATCNACSTAKTGAANGTCAFVTASTDPDSECQNPAADVCNGGGACRCFDGATNGTESDVDCGGSCNDCALGKLCNGGSDCQSNNCVTGRCCSQTTCGGHAYCYTDGNCYCNAPWEDCNSFWGDGCEINTQGNDNNNCGSCGALCQGSRYECCSGQCEDLCNPNGCNDCGYACGGQQCCDSTCGATFCCPCAAPDTLIATPQGETAIAELREGDLVLSVHQGRVVAVPLVRINRVAVALDHTMVRLRLASGRIVEMTAKHPTADGRTFGELAVGDLLGGVAIAGVDEVPYGHSHTYDVLPASDTGSYFAAGALVGSTLSAAPAFAPEVCFAP